MSSGRIGTFCEKCRNVICRCIKKKPLPPIKEKPQKVKPHFYAMCFAELQRIAKDMGYNLMLHGSLDRDMDLVAVPWQNDIKSHLELLQAWDRYLKGFCYDSLEHYMPSILGGGRSAYVINLNRGGKYNGYEDVQYYLDISITPLVHNKITPNQ